MSTSLFSIIIEVICVQANLGRLKMSCGFACSYLWEADLIQRHDGARLSEPRLFVCFGKEAIGGVVVTLSSVTGTRASPSRLCRCSSRSLVWSFEKPHMILGK